MKPPSIRARLTAWYSLILALSLAAFGGVAYLAMRHSIHSTIDAGIRQRIEGLRSIIVEDGPHGLAALQDEIREYARGEGTHVKLRVEDAAGNLIYATPGMERLAERAARKNISRVFSDEIEREHYRALRENLNVANSTYQVEVAVSTRDFDQVLMRFGLVLLLAAPVFLLLAALGGYWMSRRALAPVDEITLAARSISAQNLSRRLAVPRTGDELERLAGTLNEMLERLDSAFHRVMQFTADASHELRTPVSVIRTGAELTLRKPRSEAEYREAVSQILQESEKVSQLIEQLMDLARADSGAVALTLVPLPLSEVLCRSLGQAKILAAAKQIPILETLSSEPIRVRGDAASLERLFLILLDNAVKYTPGGGQIEVELRAAGRMATVSVRDTGIGIDTADIYHIFERFFRADKARSRELGGTGLGLSIGRWIAEAHGGEIRVTSELGKGSTFEVYLPLDLD
ncbi:MAG TPA: ATP-binding protein [Candidatus Acidoferrales bacterium]|jgi:heavy metal sensor kinase